MSEEGSRQKVKGSRQGEHEPRARATSRQAYLSFRGDGEYKIMGVGLFAKGLPAEPVSDSVAHQYETEEMKALGWVVEWRDPSTSQSSTEAHSKSEHEHESSK